MLCYNSYINSFDTLDEKYEKVFDGETILEISGMFDDGYTGVYPGEQYCGIELKTQNHIICAYIDPERNCCERYGSILSQDDVAEYIGSELKRVYLTNTANKIEYVDYIRSLRSGSTDYYNIQFINFETSKGLLQLTVYNCDNGYYGHDVAIEIDENLEYKKTVCGNMVWDHEQSKKRESFYNLLVEIYPNAEVIDVRSLYRELWQIVCDSRRKLSLVQACVEKFEVTHNDETIQLESDCSKCDCILQNVIESLRNSSMNAERLYQFIIDGNSYPFAINKLIKDCNAYLTEEEREKVIFIAKQYKPGTFEWLKED